MNTCELMPDWAGEGGPTGKCGQAKSEDERGRDETGEAEHRGDLCWNERVGCAAVGRYEGGKRRRSVGEREPSFSSALEKARVVARIRAEPAAARVLAPHRQACAR